MNKDYILTLLIVGALAAFLFWSSASKEGVDYCKVVALRSGNTVPTATVPSGNVTTGLTGLLDPTGTR